TNAGGSAVALDLYFVVVIPATAGPGLGCPNGDALAFLTNANPVITCASAPPQTFPPYQQGVTFPAGFRTTISNFLSFPWPAGAPAGTYTFAIVATPPGAFAAGSVDAGDILTFGFDSLTVSP